MFISARSLPSLGISSHFISSSLLRHLNPGCCECRAHPKAKELLPEEMAELVDNNSCPDAADGNRNPETPTWKPLPLHRSPRGHRGNPPDSGGVYISWLTGFVRKALGYFCPSSHRRNCNTQCGQTDHGHETQKDRALYLCISVSLCCSCREPAVSCALGSR